MSYIKLLIERLAKFFNTEFDFEHPIEDFKHFDDVARIKFDELKSDYDFLMRFDEHKSLKKEEELVGRDNQIDLILETRNLHFSKFVADLIMFSRTYAQYYYLRNEELTIGDIESIVYHLDKIDQLIKYQTIKLFKQVKKIDLICLNGRFVSSKNLTKEDQKTLVVIQEIIENNQHILNVINQEKSLNYFQVCSQFKVREIRGKRNFDLLNR